MVRFVYNLAAASRVSSAQVGQFSVCVCVCCCCHKVFPRLTLCCVRDEDDGRTNHNVLEMETAEEFSVIGVRVGLIYLLVSLVSSSLFCRRTHTHKML